MELHFTKYNQCIFLVLMINNQGQSAGVTILHEQGHIIWLLEAPGIWYPLQLGKDNTE